MAASARSSGVVQIVLSTDVFAQLQSAAVTGQCAAIIGDANDNKTTRILGASSCWGTQSMRFSVAPVEEDSVDRERRITRLVPDTAPLG